MRVPRCRPLNLALYVFLLTAILIVPSFSQEISASPSSLSFVNTYVGKASGAQVLTINLIGNSQVIITSISFSCPGGYGISSGVAPFTMGPGQKLTHYSVFFQPTAAQTYNCNFVISLMDGTFLNVPISGTGLTSTATATVSPSTLSFPNQNVGMTSTGQSVTITNTGSGSLTLNTINLSPLSFSTSTVALPATINAGAQLSFSVFYTPSQAIPETGALDLSYTQIPDNGSTLSGNGVAPTALAVATAATLPQATKSSAYQAMLAAVGGTGPYTWSLAAGSSLPLGLTLSSAGLISGTLDSSVANGGYQFTVQAMDSLGATATSKLTLSVYTSLGDNCNDISFDVPNTTTPMVALNDLGTGTYQGSEGGLYPNGSNLRPAAQDSYGVGLARAIQPLDANGNPSPTGKYVFLAVGESTLQNEFNRFLPIANGDPAKNPNLVLVNGAQGGATPNQFTSTTSAYWATTLNNYLPQNGVTAKQVVAAYIEDTDGIATGTFPTDISALQSQYETVMQTMLTLFPNLKMVYFGTRVYGGYSNGVGKPDNPEPYAYEVGFAVKWAIQDQLNGNANLNYNPLLGPVVAPWMSWGTYYWSNGMLGRSDGLEWDCQDFSSDGTHPSSTWGQLKVATALLNFLKTDDTTIPWYLAPKLGLTATGGNNQIGTTGSVLPTSLTAQATNLNGGAPEAGVSVTFNDNGAGGSFGTPTAITDSNGNATTTYTLPATAKTVTISATSSGYQSATFTETATAPVLALTATAGNNQSGGTGSTLPTALTVEATSGANPVPGVSVTFSDGGVGGVFGTPVATTDSNGLASTTYTLPASAQTVAISATSTGYTSASFSETANLQTLSPTAGNSQTAGPGTLLPTALTVTATSNGNPVPGVSVTFSDGGAGGSFGTPTVVTGSNGTASSTYTLPATAQTVSITATSSGYKSASFTETAAVLALSVSSGNNQSGTVGTMLPVALTVLASSNGNPVAGVSVAFSDGGVGGVFGSPTAITASNGMASSTYTLPPSAGTVTVSATSSGYTPASFSETATAPVMTLTSTAGNNQSGSTGTTLPTALAVTATINGTPAQGVSVTFSDGGAGGVFGTPTAITASNGVASTSYTLPTTAQTVTISATSSGYTPASFSETATAPVMTLTSTAGNNQSGGTGTTLPTALTVTATINGVPAQGASVTFSDGGAGGIFGTPTVITAADGTASTTYTLPPTAQTVTITAASSGFTSATFSEMADLQALSATAGNNQIGGLGSTLPISLTVRATSNGTPVAGVSVMFSDGGAGGSFGSPTGTTDANGNASTTYTLPSTAQTVTVTASSAGYMSATFTETAAVLALTATAGNNQSGMVSTTLPTALTILASSSGTPVSGLGVTFSDGGAGGVFGTPNVTTGSNGTASTTYTLPPNVETATITASSSGYTSASFTETSTPKVTAITVVSGGKQSGTVGTTLPLQIVVKAKNGTAGVVGAPITFANGGIGGTFSPNPAITGSNGQASTTFTLPTIAKKMTVTASDSGISVNITETSVAGPATSFAIVSGNNQSAHVKTKLTKNLVVSLKDQYGNPISGATVTFTDNGAGGTLSATSLLTTSSGQASVSYTTGPNTGTVTITASTGTLTPLNFTETVK
jgi:hypothetical protein